MDCGSCGGKGEGRFYSVLRIRDVYPGSRILIFTHPGSRISDPGSKNSNKREMWKKISCHTFLCSHKFHKIVNYFSFAVLKKKIWANFPGLWIRIHFLRIRIRIRIQSLMLETNTDPDTDPDPIQYGSRALITKNLKKITAENLFLFFLYQKLQFTYP